MNDASGMALGNSDISAESAGDIVAHERPTAISRPILPFFGLRKDIVVLIMLTAVYVVSYMDRQLLALLLPAINEDFEMTDTQIGYLTGVAFPIVYAIISLGCAIAADRLNRVKLIGWSVAMFSVMSIGCGAATGFWTMFLARLGVGAGEGGTPPPSMSLIADNFQGARRQWANSIYTTAAVGGVLIAYVGLGNLSAAYGWRMAFYAAGALGLIVAACVFIFLSETPKRQQESMSLADIKGFPALFRIPAFRWVMIAAIMNTVLTESTLQWLPLFLSRSLEMSQSTISWFLGLNYAILGLAGIVVGGFVATRLRRRSVGSPLKYLGAGVITVLTIAYMAACLTDSADVSLLLLGIVIFLTITFYGALLAFVQDVTPDESHAKASALLFVLMQAGFGVGSLFIGVISDALVPYFGGVESLRYALIPVIAFAGAISAFAYVMAGLSADKMDKAV